jgi:hypothetical protein
MLISTIWTKAVSSGKIAASSAITFVNIGIWYYVLQSMVNQISDWKVVVGYALGCTAGTALAMLYARHNGRFNAKK